MTSAVAAWAPGRWLALLLLLVQLLGCAADHVIGSLGLLVSHSYPGAVSSDVTAAALGDFDGDGYADLSLLRQPALANSQLCLFPGDGSGALTSQPCRELPPSWGPSQLAAVRFQQSGPAGLAVAGERLLMLLLHHDGSWLTSDDIGLTSGATALVARDLAADSPALVLVADRRDAAVLLWPLGTAGTLGAMSRYELAEAAQALLYQDLDGDGRLDLATVGPSLVSAVLGGRGQAAVGQCPAAGGAPYAGVRAMGAVALDGSGGADLLLLGTSGGGSLVALTASPGPSYDCGAATPLLRPQQPAGLLSRDLDGDGLGDLLVLGGSDSSAATSGELLLLRGQQSPANVQRFALAAPARVGAVGDLNLDGRPDIVVVLSDGSIVVLLNSFASR